MVFSSIPSFPFSVFGLITHVPFYFCCLTLYFLFIFLKMFLFIFETERDRAWAGERQRERKTQNLKQAPGSELSAQAWHGAQTHGLWDHDLSWSGMFNRLSHPGAPESEFESEFPNIFGDPNRKWSNTVRFPSYYFICKREYLFIKKKTILGMAKPKELQDSERCASHFVHNIVIQGTGPLEGFFLGLAYFRSNCSLNLPL